MSIAELARSLFEVYKLGVSPGKERSNRRVLVHDEPFVAVFLEDERRAAVLEEGTRSLMPRPMRGENGDAAIDVDLTLVELQIHAMNQVEDVFEVLPNGSPAFESRRTRRVRPIGRQPRVMSVDRRQHIDVARLPSMDVPIESGVDRFGLRTHLAHGSALSSAKQGDKNSS